MLIIFSGRSGAGKTAIAREAARQLGAVDVRIDSIEPAIGESGIGAASFADAGYRVGYALAAGNLKLGHSVVADSVKPLALTRGAWREIAVDAGVGVVDVEVVCSDSVEHRRRVGALRRVVRDRPGRAGRAGAARMLVITGSMGAGKSTVMAEASDILTAHAVVHAAVDLDGLGIVHDGGRRGSDIAFVNLQSVWRNFAADGIDALVVAAALETAADLDRLRAASAAERVVVCRLRAPVGIMQARVRVREPGMLQAQLVDRVAALERILDAAALEDFSIDNDGAPVTAVAREMLVRAGWLTPA